MYVLSVADRSGVEVSVASFGSLAAALRARDHRRALFGGSVYRVTDSDDPERGDADWCANDCGHGAFGAFCESCR